MNISELSIRRPVFAAMISVGLVVLGLVSAGRLEMKLDPEVDFPFAHVMTELRGASPDTVDREVTDILEEEINTLEGIRTLSSTSSQGLSQVSVEFEIGHDVDIKVQELRDKVALARPFLPLDVEDPIVQKFDINAIAFLTIMLGGDIGVRELSDLVEHDIKGRLQRIAGVGSIRVLGSREREVRIWLDPLRLAGYGLAIEDVADTLRRENAELASGRIEGAETEWTVTTQGKARSVDEFGELIVAERAGRLVRLRDVALVEDGMAEERTIARLDGKTGVALEILQQSGSDVVAAAREVRAELESIRQTLPPGVEIAVARDYANVIEVQVESVAFDMVLASFLVVAVVLLFLQNFRSTFIAALAIPASIIATFTFFLMFDLSLNTMTLMALSFAIGLVIDDAIVVLESIYRRVERGQGPMEAAVEGSREVGLAVVSTTLAVCGVFVPITFMQSTMGRYFYEFGLSVAVAVGVSSLVALTLTPMLASRMLSTGHSNAGVFRVFERGLRKLEQFYRGVLAWSLRHRAVTMSFAVATVLGGCGIASTLPVQYYTQDDLNEISVRVTLPVGTPLPVTDAAVREMAEVISEHPFVTHVFAASGRAERHEPHKGKVDVILIPKDQRGPEIEQTFGELRERVTPLLPEGAELSVGHPSFGDSAGMYADVQYSIQGPRLERLERHSVALMEKMAGEPGLIDLRSSHESGRPQITLDLDRGRAADLGISATSLGRTLRTLLAGEKVGSFESDGRRHDVRVQVLPEYRDDPSKIDLVRIRSSSGDLIPLRNAARIVLDEGPVEIRRENRTREIQLQANLAPGYSLDQAAQSMQAWAAEVGITAPDVIVPGGQVRSMEEVARDIVFAFGLALIAIYMILASLFNSLTHPFTIMVSAPLSFIGGFAALKLSGMSLDMMSGIGLLVLMGLVMKNGILLVDYTTQLREQGRERDDAILEAGPVRMRPVVMTSGALIFGMLPMALSDAVGSSFRAPMAMITIGGLFTSTVLTLVIVPVVYALIDDVTEWTRALFGRLLSLWGRRAADEKAAHP